jgi:hypothetical protein
LSRIINTESVGKDRNRLLRGIVISIRGLLNQKKADGKTKDYVAFIILCLIEIDLATERTVAPWEKRDYWLKADKYRREWLWVKKSIVDLTDLLKNEDWEEIAQESIRIAINLSKTTVSPNHRMGKPWIGAYSLLVTKVDNKSI